MIVSTLIFLLFFFYSLLSIHEEAGECPGGCGDNAACTSVGIGCPCQASVYRCTCNEGYEGNPFLGCHAECSPECTSVENHTCYTPYNCECNEGYVMPFLSSVCVSFSCTLCGDNSMCLAEEKRCKCLPEEYFGNPYVICEMGCLVPSCPVNSSCVARNKCECDDGYVQVPDTIDPMVCLHACDYEPLECGSNLHCVAKSIGIGEFISACECDEGYMWRDDTATCGKLVESGSCGTNAHFDDSQSMCVCNEGFVGNPYFEDGCQAFCGDCTGADGCFTVVNPAPGTCAKSNCLDQWEGEACDICIAVANPQPGTCKFGECNEYTAPWVGEACDTCDKTMVTHPDVCPRVCPTGKWGITNACGSDCQPGCVDTLCNHVNGNCEKGCDKHYFQIYMTSNCAPCATEHCANGECHDADSCAEGCETGWWGNDCSILCPEGCRSIGCAQSDGACGACEVGYHSDAAEYIQTCSLLCSPNCGGNGACDVYGNCNSGCVGEKIWTGSDCNSLYCEPACDVSYGVCVADPDGGANYCECSEENPKMGGERCTVPICQEECYNGGYCVNHHTNTGPPDYTDLEITMCFCGEYFQTLERGNCTEPICVPECVRGTCVNGSATTPGYNANYSHSSDDWTNPHNFCDCSETLYRGKVCDIPCFLTCENGGVCKLKDNEDIDGQFCDCPTGYAGEFCEKNVVAQWYGNIETLAGYIAGIAGGVVVFVGIVLFVLFTLLLFARRMKKLRGRRVVHTDASLIENIENDRDLSEEEKRTRSEVLHDYTKGLMEFTRNSKSKNVIDLGSKYLAELVKLLGNIQTPQVSLVNLIDSFFLPAFEFLTIDAQLTVIRCLERTLGVVVVFFREFKHDYIKPYQTKLIKKLTILSKNNAEEAVEYYEIRCEAICCKEAYKLLEVSTDDTKRLFSNLLHLKDVSALYRNVVSEYRSISKKWYVRLLVLRSLSYFAIKNRSEKTLAGFHMMLPRKIDRRFSEPHAVGIIQVLKSLVSAGFRSKKLIVSDNDNSISLATFLHVTGMKNSDNLRAFAYEVFRSLLTFPEIDIDIKFCCEKELIKRLFLETDESLKQTVKSIIGNIVVHKREILIKSEASNVVSIMNETFSDIKAREFTIKKRKEELVEQEHDVELLKDEIEQLQGKIEESKEEVSSKREEKVFELQKELLAIEKKIVHAAKNEGGLEMVKSLRKEKLTLEKDLFSLDNEMNWYRKLKSDLEKKKNQYEYLIDGISTGKVKMGDDEDLIKLDKLAYETQKENWAQLQRDYQLALKLQEEYLEEKTKEFEGGVINEKGSTSALEKSTIAMLSQANKYDAEPKPEYVCPISLEVMHTPVILSETGRTYEKDCIIQWLESNDTDPVSNQKLSAKTWFVNYALKSLIEDWKAEHKI